MNVELPPDAAQWVDAEIASGRSSTAQDAIGHVSELAKLVRLRAEIEAAETEGGNFTTEDVLRHVRQHLDQKFPTCDA